MGRDVHKFLLVVCLFVGPRVWAEDYVVIGSKTAAAGATNVTVPIRIANADTILGFVLPLELRSVDNGARAISLSAQYAERMVGKINDIRFANQYASADGECSDNGLPAYRTPLSRFGDTTITVTCSPWGLLFATFRLSGADYLLPGQDSSGSVLLHMQLGDTVGSFEIDTVCTYPSVHLSFVTSASSYETSNGIVPSFTKGVITIVACDCSHHGDIDGDGQITALDLSELVDYLFAGGDPPPTDSACTHVDRGDLNCDGSDDSLDLDYIIDYLFSSGPAPCNPCDCDPYPSSCQ